MNLIDIIKQNREYKLSTSKKEVKIAILANISLQTLKPILEYHLILKDINAEIIILGFNNFIEESKNTSYDWYLFFWETINLSEGIKGNYFHYSEDKKRALADKILTEIKITLAQIENATSIIFNTFSEYIFEFDPIAIDDSFNIAKYLNDSLRSLKQMNLKLFNLDSLIQQIGQKNVYDYRQFYSTSSLYTQVFFQDYAKKTASFLFNRIGGQKKMLVLDADNTLWRGIIGEDGLQGISCDINDPIGKVYNEVQLLYKFFKDQGVLLALCSKNNSEDVESVFMFKSQMVLKSDDFIIKKVNWRPKNENIIEIAQEANIGLESIVFIDDSKFEIELINSNLPEVKTILVSSNYSEYPQQIKEIYSLFFNSTKTKEDSNKTQLYHEEKNRKKSNKFKDINEYIDSLGLEIFISKNESIELSRCSQLTQKTNQFNFTSQRYSETQISRMSTSKDWLIISIKLIDKFGDYGTTGLMILKFDKEKSFLDTFLLSCRILGRKVEIKFFEILMEELKRKKIEVLIAKYIPSKKNLQVKNFLDSVGMSLVSEDLNSGEKKYKMFIKEYTSKENISIKIN